MGSIKDCVKFLLFSQYGYTIFSTLPRRLVKELHFKSDTPVLARDANTKDEDWYEIHDPRSKISQQRREISKSLMKNREKK